MSKGKVLHIISEIGGCIVGEPSDEEGIEDSLRGYAFRHEMEGMKVIDPVTGDLGDWNDMAEHAVTNFGTEGPVLVGTHGDDRVLVGVSKRYGYPGPGESLRDIIRVVRLPRDTGTTDLNPISRGTPARTQARGGENVIHYVSFNYDGENYLAAGNVEDYLAVFVEDSPRRLVRHGKTRWPSWTKFMQGGSLEVYEEGSVPDLDELERRFGTITERGRRDIQRERNISRWTDNPFTPPDASPELLDWYRKRDEAIRIWRETGDDTMAIEIGLFPSKEEEEQLGLEETKTIVKRKYLYREKQFEVARTSPDSVTVELECEDHNHEVYIVGRIEGDTAWGVGRKDHGYPLQDASLEVAIQHCAEALSEECMALFAESATAEVDLFFGADITPTLKERLDALARFVQEFESPGFEFGRMASPPGTMPHYVLSESATSFVEVCYDTGWVQPDFDWVEWKDSDEAKQLRDDPSALEEATPGQLGHLLTVLIRQDRFVEGELGDTFESGLLLGILRRAGALAGTY